MSELENQIFITVDVDQANPVAMARLRAVIEEMKGFCRAISVGPWAVIEPPESER